MGLNKKPEYPERTTDHGQAVNRRRTDNAMIKIKRTINDLQNIAQKQLEIEKQEPTKNQGYTVFIDYSLASVLPRSLKIYVR
jgi:hypothetical protein